MSLLFKTSQAEIVTLVIQSTNKCVSDALLEPIEGPTNDQSSFIKYSCTLLLPLAWWNDKEFFKGTLQQKYKFGLKVPSTSNWTCARLKEYDLMILPLTIFYLVETPESGRYSTKYCPIQSANPFSCGWQNLEIQLANPISCGWQSLEIQLTNPISCSANPCNQLVHPLSSASKSLFHCSQNLLHQTYQREPHFQTKATK